MLFDLSMQTKPAFALFFKRIFSWQPVVSQAAMILYIVLYIGLILNVMPLYTGIQQTLSEDNTNTIGQVLLETCAILSFIGFFLLLFSLSGKLVFKGVTSFIVLCSAIASFYMTFYHVVIGYGVIVSLFHTDAELSSEVIGKKLFLWLALTALVPIWLLWRTHISSSLTLSLRHWKKTLASIVALVILLALVVLPLKQLEKIGFAQKQGQESPNLAGVVAHRYLPINWISALAMVAYKYSSDKEEQQNLLSPAEKFTYILPAGQEDLTIVFVIGETTRSDHVGMLGYERETTPLLSRENNLVAFRGHSCDTATYLSLRCMFVREGGVGEDEERTLKEQNVFHTLSALGFHTEVYSMQSEVWFYNLTGARDFIFREMIAAIPGNAGKPVDDMLLAQQLQQSLQRQDKGKHLYILHTKGSHFMYSQRYPRQFARYQPECLHIDAGCTSEQLINAFDNSVLYTDYFLSQTIQTLRNKKAILFYASDHGESITDNQHFHATPRNIAPPEQRRVPMMVWMSDAFLATSEGRQAMHNLRNRQQRQPTADHTELFDSILGCSGFRSPDGGINPRNNWCN